MNPDFASLDPASLNVAQQVFGDPRLNLREFDLDNNNMVFTPMDRPGYFASSFLGARAVRVDPRDASVPLGAMLQLHSRLRLPRRPVHFLFHIGHCGSTLLSRLLAEFEGVLPLREPPPLLDLAQMRRYAGTPRMTLSHAQWRQLFELAMDCFARTWGTGETAMLKPMSHSNNLLDELLGWHPSCRGLLLYVDLPAYLAGMLKGDNRDETRMAIAESRRRDFDMLNRREAFDPDLLDDAQAAAFVWLLQMREFRAALRSPGLCERLLPMHFDDFLASPMAMLERTVAFFGLRADRQALAAALGGQVMRSYSKSPTHEFSPTQRADVLRDSMSLHAGEIDDALRWTRAFVERHPELLTAGDDLLADARLA